jgi:hypothetical protein
VKITKCFRRFPRWPHRGEGVCPTFQEFAEFSLEGGRDRTTFQGDQRAQLRPAETKGNNQRRCHLMRSRIRKSFGIFARGNSLRKRIAYSLAIVRLILVPVFFLAVYYLFAMGRIVDRIVNTDAPAAKLAEQASIETLEARRAARNYTLF